MILSLLRKILSMALHQLHRGLSPFVTHFPPSSPALFLTTYHHAACSLCLWLLHMRLPVLTVSSPSFSSWLTVIPSSRLSSRTCSSQKPSLSPLDCGCPCFLFQWHPILPPSECLLHWFRIACSLFFLPITRL